MAESFSTSGDDERIAPDESPVTVWMRGLDAGDSWSAQLLYQHFCERLYRQARQRLPANVRRGYDEEDVAVSAFDSLFRGIREQRYLLQDRTSFWRLLLTIAERKICHRIRHELQDKRDIRRRVEDSIFLCLSSDEPLRPSPEFAALPSREPTPEFAAEVADTCDALLAALPDDQCRQIALLKLENYTADEIAAKLGCARRTVQRRLLLIRRTWLDRAGIGADDLSQFDEERA